MNVQKGEGKPDSPNLGTVVSVRGSVVDIRFDDHLPPIHSVLRPGDDGRIVIEVLAQRGARQVRGIALTPTQGLARGMAVTDTGGPLKAPLGRKTSKSSPTFAGQVGAKAARKLKARRNSTQGVWFGLGMMGLIGWSVTVLTLLGAALGH